MEKHFKAFKPSLDLIAIFPAPMLEMKLKGNAMKCDFNFHLFMKNILPRPSLESILETRSHLKNHQLIFLVPSASRNPFEYP